MILAVATLVVTLSADALAATEKAAAAVDCKSDATYAEISKKDLQHALDSKTAFVIDVNSDDSYKEHHVPGAIHFKSTKNFAKALPADKNAMLVSYCGGPACTAWKKAATEACKLGYTNVRHFKDGISGWVKN